MEYFPNQKPDSEQLLAIFPKEIWKKILEKMHNVDYLHLCKSSPYFKEQCKHLRVQTLFPEVANVLFANLKKSHSVLWQIFIKCRMVCRTWQKGVDTVLHNDQNCFELTDAAFRFDIPFDTFQYYTENFRTQEDIESFLSRFDDTYADTNRNPFVCRRVRITYGGRTDPEGRLAIQQILQLLRVYGHHIWYCWLIVNSDDIYGTTLSNHTHLREMLVLMPNLKTLTLNSTSNIRSEMGLEDLQLQVETNPFPQLKHLHYIEFCPSAPTPIFEGLLHPNRHIKMLAAMVWNTKGNNVLFRETLPELKQISMILQRERHLQQLENLDIVWPLTKLSVSVADDSIRVGDLFRLLKNKWAGSLTELTLFLYRDEHLEMPALELPKLKSLTMQNEYFTPLDFLLACKQSLSSLTVNVEVRINSPVFQPRLQSALENEKAVRFYGFRNNLIYSNIWALFPNLRSVEYNDLELPVGSRRRPATRRFEWMLKQFENA